jgi:hypothetical protein
LDEHRIRGKNTINGQMFDPAVLPKWASPTWDVLGTIGLAGF